MQRIVFVWRAAIAVIVCAGLLASEATWADVPAPAGLSLRPTETLRPSLKVAAVQARLRFFPTEAQYASYIMARAEEAMRHRPDLVVFPEDIGLPLVSLGDCNIVCAESKTVSEAVKKLAARYAVELEALCRNLGVGPVRGLWLLKAGRIRRAYQATFQRAAQRFRVYIVAGSVPMTFPDAPGQVFNTCCLFSPDGRMHVMARKVHLVDLEGPQGLDFSAGSPETYRTFDLPWAKIGCIVCADAWAPAIARRLVDDGAQVLVQVSANPALWTVAERENWQAGLFARVQELDVYGVTCMAVGRLLDVPFEGQTQILAPKEWTKDGTGVLAEAPVVRSETVVAARFDLHLR